MNAPLGRSFQSVLEELAEEMEKFNEMDEKTTNSLERNTKNLSKTKESEVHHVR